MIDNSVPDVVEIDDGYSCNAGMELWATKEEAEKAIGE